MSQNNPSARDLIDEIAERFEAAQLYYGHGTDNAFDEAVHLVFYVLDLPFDTDEDHLKVSVSNVNLQKVNELAERRIKERKPLAYLIHHTYFAGLSFYVDERVQIPRTPFAELIENQFRPWIHPDRVKNILDLCTGSGCIAIACAKYFPDAHIDATDISKDALEVAEINIEKNEVQSQVHLIESDVFKNVSPKKYDLIVSNPPYVSSDEMQTLPDEYLHEPNISLETSDDGLKIVLEILNEAKNYLADEGVLIVEVGNSQVALEERLPHVPFMWLEFEYGGEGVFLLTAEQVRMLDLRTG